MAMKTPKPQENNPMFAGRIKAQVDVLYAKLTSNPQNALSYQDICQITDFVQYEFSEHCGECPQIVRGACQFSRGLLNPDKIEGMNQMRMGIGLLITVVGGLGLLWGILIAMGVGMSMFATVVAAVTGGGIPIAGPLAIGFGIAAIAAGIYVGVSFMSPQALSARAHDAITDAIDKWGFPEKAAKADQQVKVEMGKANATATLEKKEPPKPE